MLPAEKKRIGFSPCAQAPLSMAAICYSGKDAHFIRHARNAARLICYRDRTMPSVSERAGSPGDGKNEAYQPRNTLLRLLDGRQTSQLGTPGVAVLGVPDGRRRGLVRIAVFLMSVTGALSCTLAPAQATGALASDNPSTSDQDRVIDRASRQLFSNTCHVGLSIAVSRDARGYFYDYGSTSRETAKLPTPDSVYEIGSVTKTFTGALAAQALVDHRMALDADFRSYLPASYPNLAWQGKPITLRTLATHRSGLPRDLPDTDDLYSHVDFETLPSRLIARDAPYDHARYLRELHGVQLTTAPGEREAYSNLGLKVLGFGLETISGAAFETLVSRDILQPLGMSSTGFVVSTADQPRLVEGYSRGGHRMPYHLRNAGAAYGLYSTTRDMAQYLRWQLDERLMLIRRAHEPLIGDQTDGKAMIWNLALASNGHRLLWHGGGTFGMTSQVVLFPEDHQGFVLLANDTCEGTERALRQLAVAVHDSLGR